MKKKAIITIAIALVLVNVFVIAALAASTTLTASDGKGSSSTFSCSLNYSQYDAWASITHLGSSGSASVPSYWCNVQGYGSKSGWGSVVSGQSPTAYPSNGETFLQAKATFYAQYSGQSAVTTSLIVP